jgi:hypothetical protein
MFGNHAWKVSYICGIMLSALFFPFEKNKNWILLVSEIKTLQLLEVYYHAVSYIQEAISHHT